MKRHAFASLCLTLLLCIPVPVLATGSPGTDQQLAALRLASGGVHWDKVMVIVTQGTVRQDGMNCSLHDVVDLQNGDARQGTHCPAYSTAEGIGAAGAWSQDNSGQLHSLDSPEAKTLTITDRWLNRRGPLFPRRLPAMLKTLAPVTADGVTYDRVDATPADGRSVTLWIDRESHRLARTVMRRSFLTVTTLYSDYRDVDGLQLPFRITTESGKPVQITTETVTRYELPASLPADALERPSDAVTDVNLPGGRTQVPLLPSVEGLIMVRARIDGQGPFVFALDTGGHAILTPATAKQLGLKATGKGIARGAGAGSTGFAYTRVRSVQLGAAKISNQSFLVMPLGPIVTDRGDKPPVAGLLGLEIFERFAVTLDLAHHQLILQSFNTAKPPRHAIGLPIYFTADVPLVYATLDGKRGIFQIDTGNPTALMVFPDWAEQNGLARYYLAGVAAMAGGGVGGDFTTHAAYIRSLKLGDLAVPGQLIAVLTPPGVNAVSNPSDAGNLGMTVWRNFRVTFNYRKGLIYLTPRAHYAPKPVIASGGFVAIKLAHDAFTVVKVTPHGAATKVGLKAGDQIVDVDGVPAKNLASVYLVKYIDDAKPGDKLNLTLAGGHHVAIVLTSDAAMEKALHPTVQ